MKLYRRYSRRPLLELRLDRGTDRTVADRPYLVFWCSENAESQPKKRMKALPMSAEEAHAFVMKHGAFLMDATGKPWARWAIHHILKSHGFDVRKHVARSVQVA